MTPKVALIATAGELAGREYHFEERATRIIGRHAECDPQIQNADGSSLVSRHHCLLDINPPAIRIRDFGSMNGTYVNGRKIGQRHTGQSPEEGQKLNFPQVDLHDGDEVAIGEVKFRVSIENDKAAKRLKAKCVGCGKPVGAVTPGDAASVCSDCAKAPDKAATSLLDKARRTPEAFPTLAGYEYVRELGRGGMGAVFLIKERASGNLAALKTMLPKIATSDRAVKMFLRETELSAALRHKNIVALQKAGSADDIFYQVLEYCEGGSISDLMDSKGRLPLSLALNVTYQVLDGLEHAHRADLKVTLSDGTVRDAKGLVHRDLKPPNILISGSLDNPTFKIADFGLSKAFDLAGLSGLSLTTGRGGTLGFMPRQQVINYKYAKPEVDLWSAAATLFYMLTGSVPKEFRPDDDPWRTVLQSSARPIRTLLPRVPAPIAEVIDAALVEQPSLVFKEAHEMKEALQRAAAR